MSTSMPIITTSRLTIRCFEPDDLEAVHEILDHDFIDVGGGDEPLSRQEREAWLTWTVANHEQLGHLYQPPYGDKAVILRETGQLIGLVGFVPSLGPFDQIPILTGGQSVPHARWRPEVGLFYQISRQHRRQGYAVEAAQALIDYGFDILQLQRIIATTDLDNLASQAVMRQLGMELDRNPFPYPDWLQCVGVILHPGT